jgi:Skp family chaperone for outer membrane proteins
MPLNSIFGLSSYTPSFLFATRAGAGRAIQGADVAAAFRNSPQSTGLAADLDQLFNAFATSINSVNARRSSIEQARSELTKLRDALESARQQASANGGRPDLRAVYQELERIVAKAGYSKRDVSDTRAAYQTRSTDYGIRNVYATRPTYGVRDIYQTQPVYEDQDIYATIVNGTEDLSSSPTISSTGIDTGADLSIQVGSGSAARIEFDTSTRIKLIVDGSTTDFTFASGGGAWRTGFLDALNAIENLSASYNADGTLRLETANAESLTISDVPNGFLDFSGSPLGDLGLTAGTTQSSVVGTQQVQVGTEEVVVGQEQYVNGQEQYVAGQEGYDIGVDAQDFVTAASSMLSATGGVHEVSAEVLSLLQSRDFKALGDGDVAAFDRMIRQIDDALARTEAFETELVESRGHYDLALELQTNVSAMLLSAGQSSFGADPVGLARQTGDTLRKSPFGIGGSGRSSIWV